MAALLKYKYNEAYINLLQHQISIHFKTFNSEDFIHSVFDENWEERELKQRMRHIATVLGLYLPTSYKDTIDILISTFQSMNDSYGLENMIFQDFVALHGLDDFDTSMKALEHFTINSSSEFAIREFILQYEDETMKQMLVWAKSENEHIRRLASEGSRSRLPWAISLPKFKKNPTPILKIIELLKDDLSPYVRKSVANSLNDISKDNPLIVKEIAKEWIGHSENRNWILKHGCRTLLKASDSEILELFGCLHPTNLQLHNFQMNKNIKMGDTLTFSFDLQSDKVLGLLRIEFALFFLRKNGKHNKKSFKIAEANYIQKEKHISKGYSFKPISTRVYYRGAHKIAIIINGKVFKEAEFTLF